MIYKVSYNDSIFEFVENKGRAFLQAADPADALIKTRENFAHIREEQVQTLGSDQYLITFKIDFQYHRNTIKAIRKTVRYVTNLELYREARVIDRYILAHICRRTGKPEWLQINDFNREIRMLRKEAVVAREVSNVMDFIDWDICIYNFIELNSKKGHKSRVVRRVKAC
ncbi:MAG: hypothetical protein ACOYVF_06070 [Candidatus Zixiibacteriota bacterium]